MSFRPLVQLKWILSPKSGCDTNYRQNCQLLDVLRRICLLVETDFLISRTIEWIIRMRCQRFVHSKWTFIHRFSISIAIELVCDTDQCCFSRSVLYGGLHGIYPQWIVGCNQCYWWISGLVYSEQRWKKWISEGYESSNPNPGWDSNFWIPIFK